mgnify:FL=1
MSKLVGFMGLGGSMVGGYVKAETVEDAAWAVIARLIESEKIDAELAPKYGNTYTPFDKTIHVCLFHTGNGPRVDAQIRVNRIGYVTEYIDRKPINGGCVCK